MTKPKKTTEPSTSSGASSKDRPETPTTPTGEKYKNKPSTISGSQEHKNATDAHYLVKQGVFPNKASALAIIKANNEANADLPRHD